MFCICRRKLHCALLSPHSQFVSAFPPARLDVTKQKDLSGFYRHLLNQAVGEEALPKSSFREAR